MMARLALVGEGVWAETHPIVRESLCWTLGKFVANFDIVDTSVLRSLLTVLVPCMKDQPKTVEQAAFVRVLEIEMRVSTRMVTWCDFAGRPHNTHHVEWSE